MSIVLYIVFGSFASLVFKMGVVKEKDMKDFVVWRNGNANKEISVSTCDEIGKLKDVAVISLIGCLNIINTISTNLMLRKRELAMMMAVSIPWKANFNSCPWSYSHFPCSYPYTFKKNKQGKYN